VGEKVSAVAAARVSEALALGMAVVALESAEQACLVV
jgi:hypothetical protein